MFNNLLSSVPFPTSSTDYGGIFKLLDKCFSKVQEFLRELLEVQYEINNMSYSSGLIILLFIILDILILITVFYIFRRKESYEKISKISVIIAITIAILSFIFGYSFYDRPYANEFPISPYYADTKNYALVGLWFGLQGFLLALIICQAIALLFAWLNKPSTKEYNKQ